MTLSTPVLIALLVLVLVAIAGNTMIAAAFLRNRKVNFRNMQSKGDADREELHERVRKLREPRE